VKSQNYLAGMQKNIENQSKDKAMQIVIPMSGFGERFRLAGYDVPKPLIVVDEKPIIQHVVEMFSHLDKFIFICNEGHLLNPKYRMKSILQEISPHGKIISIKSHKLGPVYAVMNALDKINLRNPTIVNYCDFSCYWDYDHFKDYLSRLNPDGVIPSYRGFHPHTLWSNYYAYLRENNYRASDIQEKKPFTEKPRDEFASSGTYYFKTGALMKKYFQRCVDEELMVSNEYYVSMAYKPMMQDNLRVYVYELQHFMQWGTPGDMDEYRYWSDIFRSLSKPQKLPKHDGALLLPMAGLGSRFQKEGYTKQKPLIPVSGFPMAVQAKNNLPNTELQRYVVRKNIEGLDDLIDELTKTSKNPSFKILNHNTDGQASTCIDGSVGLDIDAPVTIAACDNGMIYDTTKFNDFMMDKDVDIIVWGARGYPGAIRSPEMYGWINVDNLTDKVKYISVKKPLENPTEDLIVVGAFTFKKLKYFLNAVQRMKDRKGVVNGEYYVDTAINDAVQLNYKCKVFEIDNYICWGTPNDLKTFEYWQSCFHKWESHPYKMDYDNNVSKSSINELKDKYKHETPNKHKVAS
jgi:NDP-sugar pyrophosphorylase family protein